MIEPGVTKYPLATPPLSATNSTSGGADSDWRKLLLSAGFEDDLAASYAQLWSGVPCPSYKRVPARETYISLTKHFCQAIPFDRLKDIPGTRMGHVHRLMKWANS